MYDPPMLTAAVLTISDTRSEGTAVDRSGPAVAEMLGKMGLDVRVRKTIPDDLERIRADVKDLVGGVALVVTTGGTGVADRDVTPEAVTPLFDRVLPGFGEIMRTGGYEKTPLAIISRGGAGISGRTLIVMLPGSPKAATEGLTLLGPAILHVLKFLGDRPVNCELDARSAS